MIKSLPAILAKLCLNLCLVIGQSQLAFQAYAEDDNDPQQQASQTGLASGQANELVNNVDAEKTHYRTDEYKGSSGGDSNVLQNILEGVLTFAIAYVASTSAFICKAHSLSFILFYTGAVTYIASVFVGMKNQESGESAIASSYLSDSADNKQASAFERAAQQKDKQADTAKLVSTLQLAAAAQFLAASGLALVEYMKMQTALRTCQSNLAACKAAATARAATCAAPHSGCGHEVGPATGAAEAAAENVVTSQAEDTQVQTPISSQNGGGVLALLTKLEEGATRMASLAGATAVAGVCAAGKAACALYVASVFQDYIPCAGPLGVAQKSHTCRPKQYFAELEKKYFQNTYAQLEKANTDIDAVFIFKEHSLLTTKHKYQSPSIIDYEKSQVFYAGFENYGQRLKDYLKVGLTMGWEFLFPKAHASGGLLDLLSLGGGAMLPLFVATKTSVGTQITTWIGSPLSRSIMFAAFGAVTGGVALMSKKQGDQYKKEADELRRLAAKMRGADKNNERSGVVDLQDPNTEKSLGVSTSSYTELDGSLCFKSPGQGNPSGSDVNCECQKNNTCRKVALPKQNASLNRLKSTPSILKSTSNDAAALGNDITSGKISSAAIKAESLSKKIASLQKTNKELQKLANTTRFKSGLKKVNFGKEIAKKLTTLNQEAKSSISASGGLGALGKTPSIFNPIAYKKSKKSNTKVQKSLNVGTSSLTKPGQGEADMADFLSLEDKKVPTINKDILLETSRLLESDKEGNFGHEDEQKNIFGIISRRYIRSIPLMFDSKPKEATKD